MDMDSWEEYEYNFMRTRIEAAFKVLNRMMDSFESWFPIDASDTDEEIEMYKEGFARAKLSLELGIMRSTVRRSGFLWRLWGRSTGGSRISGWLGVLGFFAVID